VRHPHKALNSARLAAITEPGRHGDGGGLYLEVEPSGAKRWILRVMVKGRRRDIGLGGLKTTGLAKARDDAARMRAIARAGGDPLADRAKSLRTVPTFKEAAEAVHEEHKTGWRNAKHRAQWLSTLKAYAYKRLGTKAVSEIQTSDVLAVLSPIWRTKPETARRVRQRIGVVMDWAKAAGHRSGDNPIDGVTKGLPAQPERKNHHAALPYAEIATFIQDLRQADNSEVVRLAFEFTILTAARTGEVLGARWKEIDFDSALWTVPAGRMKGSREHRVPLSARCIEILKRAEKIGGKAFVFEGREDLPLSGMAMLMVLRRLGAKITVHGFRSAFRDWASEQTNFPRDVCEMALAHSIKDKTEAAYRRGDLLEKRRELMKAWATYAVSMPADNVVPLKRRSAKSVRGAI
jgi:integrase